MDFFDFLFGKKEDKSSNKEQVPSNNKTSKKVNDYKPFPPVQPSQQSNTVSVKPVDSGISPVELYVKESVADLKKHTELSTKALEAEAIYLAAFLYLKDSFQIDFNLDYFSDGLIDKIPSGNFPVADKVFSYMMKYGEGHYGAEERDFGVSGYKMNIQLTPDYGSYIKNYFIRAHKIGSGKDFTVFSSPRNCLWKSGIKSIDSPTQRDIYYKFDGNSFEFMIPPYNPLVTGRIVEKTATTLRCESGDGRRTFVFHYDDEIKPECLNYIEMFRNDKGDMVSYHKDKEDNSVSLDHIARGEGFEYNFHKMFCTLKRKGQRFGSLFIMEEPIKNNLTADLSYSSGKLTLDLPEIDLIRERGGINIDSHIEVTGTFEKDNFDSDSTCYKLSSNGIEVQVICKRSTIFSFVEIPVSGSTNPQYRGYDTLSLELDLTK